jgi:uncharacterized protein YoxC
MHILKIVFLIIAIISVPLLSLFLIRLVLKMGLGFTHINHTLDDARPQINMLLSNLNHTMEDLNGELEKVGRLTEEAQEMLNRSERSLQSVEKALRSPLARYGGITAAFLATTSLVRGILRRSERRKLLVKRMMRDR